MQDLNNLPPNAVALTKAGRPFNKAAEELHTHLNRRIIILAQYEALRKELAPVLEEIVRSHARIDEIINELSPDAEK